MKDFASMSEAEWDQAIVLKLTLSEINMLSRELQKSVCRIRMKEEQEKMKEQFKDGIPERWQ